MSFYYCVHVLRHWDSLAAGPFQVGGMSGAEGCIGFMPIFATKTAALAWRDENHPDASVAAFTDDVEVTTEIKSEAAR